MLEGRYLDKRFLTKYDLSVELFESFDLKVSDLVPIRNVFVLSTNKGEKILKRVDYSLENLNFINKALKYVKKNFNRVLDFTELEDNKICIEWKKELYCVMDLVPGRECDFCNPIDVKIAAEGLAELHKASIGFKSSEVNKNKAGKTIDCFERRLQEMEFFKSLANLHEYKSDFDKIFLENYEQNVAQIKESIDILKNSGYYELSKEQDKIVLCHNDLAYHNILINEEKAYFVDFDYSVIDLRINDLCNFISKAIKNFAFDIEKAVSILDDYQSSNSLDKREIRVLYGMLYFPEDFYSISRDYYTKRKDWEEEVFLDRLIKKVSYKEDRQEFLDEFKEKILK
ncbi:CotS family spore coat protein [Clostridium swellfunianum]|uniref:CotS family spore coat protein n=1 Tax=Clostridium swellfunianum TaxID=1367462 RepID=UPI00202E48F4|nr:CotS family spore coat protein [Clostridium swellfunianum]MCM0649693.1 CotS family spore coat protein [Clostridium swellfunianum]